MPNRLTERAAKLAEEGKFAEAIAEHEERAGDQPAQRARCMYALAQRYAQAGDAQNAMKWLGTAIRRQPTVWKPRAAEDPLFAKLRDLAGFQTTGRTVTTVDIAVRRAKSRSEGGTSVARGRQSRCKRTVLVRKCLKSAMR